MAAHFQVVFAAPPQTSKGSHGLFETTSRSSWHRDRDWRFSARPSPKNTLHKHSKHSRTACLRLSSQGPRQSSRIFTDFLNTGGCQQANQCGEDDLTIRRGMQGRKVLPGSQTGQRLLTLSEAVMSSRRLDPRGHRPSCPLLPLRQSLLFSLRGRRGLTQVAVEAGKQASRSAVGCEIEPG